MIDGGSFRSMSALPPPELVEVTPGVFAYIQPDGSWMINNTGVIADPDGAYVLVDTTSTEARNRALLEAVEKISPDAPRALVNTHHHGDHTFGNWLMPAQTPIIGHADCREDVIASGNRWLPKVWSPWWWVLTRVVIGRSVTLAIASR